jgi:hypothetical protein
VDFGISEASARLWDAITKVIAAFGLISGGLWTLKKYFDDRANERELSRERAKSAEVEARKPFSSKQLDLYLEAVRIAGLIAASDSNDREAAERAFWSLYLGPLSLVEDGKVAAAMVNFGTALNKGASQEDLQVLAIALSHACRQSIAESWKVSLPSFDAPRPVNPPKQASSHD